MSDFETFDYFGRYIQNEIKNEFTLYLNGKAYYLSHFRKLHESQLQISEVSETLETTDMKC